MGRGRDPLTGRDAEAGGFTLLEVLVALAVLAIAITMVLQLFSANMRGVFVSGGLTSAAIRGDARIREILAEPSLVEKVWSEATEDGYQMDVSVSEILKERTDNLPVRLMEVVLTVRWKEGLRERRFHLKTVKMIDRMSPSEKPSTAPA